MTHGRITAGTVTTPDLAAALADYAGVLGLPVIEQGPVSPALAAGWGRPMVAGRAHAVLAAGEDCFLRLVEQPRPPAFVPRTSFGWGAFEFTVADVWGWPERLAGSGLRVIGPPREIPGLPYFVAMQAEGPGGETIYLNEVRSDTPTSDLPRATRSVDRIFIVILACPDRPAALTWYRERLGLDIGADYTIPYTMIARAFDLPLDMPFTITMAQAGRMPIVEVDGYPPAATPRPGPPELLPAGNALVTLAVDDLDTLDLPWLAATAQRPGAVAAGRRSATVAGAAGELLELVER